jgi:hypothetical protein
VKGSQCIFRGSEDGRRQRKSRLDDVASRAEAFDALLSSIKGSDNTSLHQLFDLVRYDRPIQELSQIAREITKSNELRTKSRNRLRQAAISIASLTDNPPIRVPASPWTRITVDDNAVSHLVSIYFTWHHHHFPSLDRDLFVKHMKSKELSSQYCSPLLVNSILATASVGMRRYLRLDLTRSRCILTIQSPSRTQKIVRQEASISWKKLRDCGTLRTAEHRCQLCRHFRRL